MPTEVSETDAPAVGSRRPPLAADIHEQDGAYLRALPGQGAREIARDVRLVGDRLRRRGRAPDTGGHPPGGALSELEPLLNSSGHVPDGQQRKWDEQRPILLRQPSAASRRCSRQLPSRPQPQPQPQLSPPRAFPLPQQQQISTTMMDEPQAGTIVVSVVEAHDCHLALRHSMRPASKGSLAAEKNCREGKISSPSRDVSGGAPPGRENGGSYV